MIPTQPRSVLNWSACAELIGDMGVVDQLDEVVMTENDLRDRVQLLVEASRAYRELEMALRESEAKRTLGIVEQDADSEDLIARSRAMLEALGRKLCYYAGREDVTTAHVVATAADRFLFEYDQRVYAAEQALATRFAESEATTAAAVRDLHEMLDAGVEARAEDLNPLRFLLKRVASAPIVVESGKQLNLVH